MKKEYHEDTNSIWVSFAAGRSPMPYWHCIVVYTVLHTKHKPTVWVYTIQTVGFGEREDRVRHETEMATLADVHHLLRYYKDMEACYKAVYGE